MHNFYMHHNSTQIKFLVFDLFIIAQFIVSSVSREILNAEKVAVM